MGDWVLYMIRTANGSLYTGITTEPVRRLREHRDGLRTGAKALRGKGPLELVFQLPFADRAQASRAEHRVKKLPKAHKELLVQGVITLQSLVENDMKANSEEEQQ